MPKRRGAPRQKRKPGIGEYLTGFRERQEKTQQQIATEIKKSRSFVCRIERGERREESLRGLILYDLAKAYGAPIAELLKKANWEQLLLLDTEGMQELLQYLKRIPKRKRQQ